MYEYEYLLLLYIAVAVHVSRATKARCMILGTQLAINYTTRTCSQCVFYPRMPVVQSLPEAIFSGQS